MKKLIYIFVILLSTSLFSSCKDKEDNGPDYRDEMVGEYEYEAIYTEIQQDLGYSGRDKSTVSFEKKESSSIQLVDKETDDQLCSLTNFRKVGNKIVFDIPTQEIILDGDKLSATGYNNISVSGNSYQGMYDIDKKELQFGITFGFVGVRGYNHTYLYDVTAKKK